MKEDETASDERLPGRKADEVDAVELPEAPSSRTTWTLFLAGPTIWFVHFMVVYLTVEAVCVGGRTGRELWGLPLASTVTAVATALAVVAIAAFATVAHRRWREDEAVVQSQDDLSEEAVAARGRDRPLAFAGFALGVLFIIAVLYVGLPALWLTPC